MKKLFLKNSDNLTVNSFILELRSDKHVCNDVTVHTYLRGLRAFLYYCMEMDYMATFKIRIPKDVRQ